MTVAAALEYLHLHARMAPVHQPADAEEDTDAAEHDDDYNALSADDAVEPQNHQDREEAGTHWLAEAGFDRKD